MKLIKVILTIGFVLYSLFCVGLYIGQDQLIFLPDKLSENHRFRLGEEVEIQVEEGVFLNCLLIETPTPKGVILYLHGNKGSNRRCLYQATKFTGADYDIFMPDYRGYGKSDGSIGSEKQLYNDVQKVYDYLVEKYGEDRIVVAGYSLGTGMASYLAANNHPKQLVLNSPYVSFYDLKDRRLPFIPDFLVKYPLDNKEYLSEITIPVTLFHGTRDELIPFESSEILKRENPDRVTLIPLNTGHRQAIFSDKFSSTLREILR